MARTRTSFYERSGTGRLCQPPAVNHRIVNRRSGVNRLTTLRERGSQQTGSSANESFSILLLAHRH